MRIDECQDMIFDRTFRSTEQIITFHERFIRDRLPVICEKTVNAYIQSVRTDHIIHSELMWSFDNQTSYWDWKIRTIVDKQETNVFFVHRYILGTKSDYFHKAFSQSWEHDSVSSIEVSQKTSNSFPIFLDYLYTGNIQIKTTNMMPLLWLSDYFAVRSLLEKVLRRIKVICNEATWSNLAQEAMDLGIYDLVIHYHQKFKRIQLYRND